jgi:hypothetical protein
VKLKIDDGEILVTAIKEIIQERRSPSENLSVEPSFAASSVSQGDHNQHLMQPEPERTRPACEARRNQVGAVHALTMGAPFVRQQTQRRRARAQWDAVKCSQMR